MALRGSRCASKGGAARDGGSTAPDTGNGVLLLFDFDGVIADSLPVLWPEFTQICEEMGYRKLNSKRAFLKLFEGNALKELWKRGFPLWRIRRLIKRFETRIMVANEQVLPFEGLPELISELAEHHPLYIVTSNASLTVERFAAKHHIEGVRGVLGADTHSSKVKKIRRLCREYPGHEAYFVSDTKGDMLEGRTAKAITVAVGWGWHDEQTLREGEPSHFVETPADLRRLLLPT